MQLKLSYLSALNKIMSIYVLLDQNIQYYFM